MPISPITLQRRFAELGRIRLGAKVPVGDKGKTRPEKLTAFRFTSPNQRYVNDLATLYGGQAKAWDNNGKPEFEVFTDATSIPVIAMKGGLSQWMETWSGGGCIHRCDGEVNALTGEPCDLRERVQIGRDNINPHEVAKPTTRLSLMLPELEAIGAWRMESHGWNAAAEIPAVAELAQFVGDLVPAHLNMIERRSVRDGKTSRFVVPVLDLQIGTARLRELVAEKSGTTVPELEAPAAGGRPALAAPTTAPPTQAPFTIPTPQQIADADLDAVTRMLADLETNLGEHPATAAARERVRVLSAARPTPAEPDDDGIVDAEVVPDDQPTLDGGTAPEPPANADQVWQQIVTTAGQQGTSLPDLQDDFAAQMGGVTADTASVGEMQAYLQLLQMGASA